MKHKPSDDAHLWEALQKAREAKNENKIAWAKQDIAIHHQAFLFWYANRYKAQGADPEEYMAELNLSMATAINLYQPERGKFSTYLELWCRQALSETLRRNQRVPVSKRSLNKILSILRARRWLELDGNFDPTPQEIADTAEVSLEWVTAYLNMKRFPIGLTDKVGEGETTFGDLVADDFDIEATVLDSLALDPHLEYAQRVINTIMADPDLGPLDHDLILSWMSPTPVTQQRIADTYGVSRQMVSTRSIMLRRRLEKALDQPTITQEYSTPKSIGNSASDFGSIFIHEAGVSGIENTDVRPT